MKDSGWRFDKINSRTVYFHETGETIRFSYVKFPLRSSDILNILNIDKYCFWWSILAYLHAYNKNNLNRVSNYRQSFDELNIECLDFTYGFNCNDVYRFEKLNILSINIFELNFYQDQNKWGHKLIPIEVSKNEPDRVIDLLIWKDPYALSKILIVFLGDINKKFVCRRCLFSYTSKNMLMLHEPKSENNDITSFRTTPESHLHWKNYFFKKPLYFRIYADFEADNEIDISSIGNKATNIYKQNPVLNGYHIESELNDFLKSGYYKSPLGYSNVDWFVDEVVKLEIKRALYFKNTNKIIIMTNEKKRSFQK